VKSKFLPEGRVEMVFEPVSKEEWEELVERVRGGMNVWRAVAEILRRRNLRG
jgi:hypothetical protein